MGYSDTLWYGRDHFSDCRHIEGMRAIVRYKPGTSNAVNDLVGLELRVDVPIAAKSAPQQQAASN